MTEIDTTPRDTRIAAQTVLWLIALLLLLTGPALVLIAWKAAT